MRVLTRYLMREIMLYFVIFGAFLLSIMAIYESFNLRDDYVEYSPSVVEIITYLLYRLPGKFKEVLPMVGLLSTCFAYGLLAKNREILAMVATGISFFRLTVPVFITGIFLCGLIFLFNEELVPYTDKKADYIGKTIIKKKKTKPVQRRKNILTHGARDEVYCIPYYLLDLNTMIYPVIMKLAPGGGEIIERLDADRAVLIPEGHEDAGLWAFVNLQRRIFNSDGSLLSHESLPGTNLVKLRDSLEEILRRGEKTSDMNFAELKTYMDLMSGNFERKVDNLRISLRQKIVWPISGLLLTLAGFVVVVDVHARRFARGVSVGLLLAVGFYVLNVFLVNLGQKDMIAPFLASWLALALLTVVTIYLGYQLTRVRK